MPSLTDKARPRSVRQYRPRSWTCVLLRESSKLTRRGCRKSKHIGAATVGVAAAMVHGQKMPSAIAVSVGNPKYGTKFMLNNPIAAIDFPPKADVYEDNDGKVWISYNTSEYLYRTIFARHGLKHPEGDVELYAQLLEELTNTAIAPNTAG